MVGGKGCTNTHTVNLFWKISEENKYKYSNEFEHGVSKNNKN